MVSKKRYWCPLGVSPVRKDTEALLRKVLEQPPGKALELGCGTGYVSIELAKRGWEVTGTDVLLRALEISKKNALSEGVSVEFLHSNLFSHVCGKSDAIIFNPPLVFSEKGIYSYARGLVHRIPPLNNLLESLFLRFPNRARRALISLFLRGARQHLTLEGFIYLAIFKGDLPGVKALVRQFESSRAGKNALLLKIPCKALRR